MAKIEKTIELDVSADAAYSQMARFEDFPAFMDKVREVRRIDDTHVHWRSEIDGKEVEWDCEITEQLPPQRIAWRGTQGMRNTGQASCTALGENRTRLTLNLDVEGPSEDELVASAEEDLQHFKRYIEDKTQSATAQRQQPAPASNEQGGQANNDAAQSAQAVIDQAGRFGKKALEAARENIGRASQQANELSSAAARNQQVNQQTIQSNALNAVEDMTLRPLRSSLPWWSAMFDAFDEPFSAMRRFSEEMHHELEGVLSRNRDTFGRGIGAPATSAGTWTSAWTGALASAWTPNIDVSQQDGQLVVAADLPGIRKEDVSIEINDGQLIIRGERRAQNERPQQQQAYARIECSYGSFTRVIPLPAGVEAERAEASMTDGVLRIRLPSPVKQQGHHVEIRGSESASPRPDNAVQFERRNAERRQQVQQRNAA